MVLDKRILFGGIAMLAAGFALYAVLSASTPIGHGGMTEEQKLDFMIKEQQNQDAKTLAGMLIGIGFLLILISFGARRKSKGSPVKTEKKPAE